MDAEDNFPVRSDLDDEGRGHHVREVFQQELSQVKDLLVSTSKEVTYAIQGATSALLNADLPLAESVITHDKAIDSLTTDLDELLITILAKQQPVARDLRVVLSALRISANLERMGDLAKHIARIATYYPEGRLGENTGLYEIFAEFTENVVDLSEQVTRLLETEDVAIAQRIAHDDDIVDSIHARVFEITLADDWKGSRRDTVNITLANRFFERFADHAVRISEKMEYLATGDWNA